MERQKVRFRKHDVKRVPFPGNAGRTIDGMTARVEHRHPKPGGSLRHGLTDAPHPDDAQGFSGDVGAQQLRRCPSGPVAGPNPGVCLNNTPCQSKQQRPRQIRSGIGEHIWCIGDGNASPRGSGHVDVVIADRIVGYDFQFRRMGEQRRVDAIIQRTDHRVGLSETVTKLLRCRWPIDRFSYQPIVSRNGVHHRLREQPGNKEGRAIHHEAHCRRNQSRWTTALAVVMIDGLDA